MESLYITKPSTAEPKPLKIKLLETPPDERREFVECALDLLVRSRFGPGANLSEIVDLDDLFEPEPYVEYDLTAKCHRRGTSPHAVFGVRALRATQRGRRLPSAFAALIHDTAAAAPAQRPCNALTPCGLVPSNHSPPILGRNAADLCPLIFEIHFGTQLLRLPSLPRRGGSPEALIGTDGVVL